MGQTILWNKLSEFSKEWIYNSKGHEHLQSICLLSTWKYFYFFFNLCFNILIIKCGYKEEQRIVTMTFYHSLSLPALLIFIQLHVLYVWKSTNLFLNWSYALLKMSLTNCVKIQHENWINPQNLNTDKIMCLISFQIQNCLMSVKEFALFCNTSF